VLIALPAGGGYVVDTWLLSCRAMGRTVERGMFAHLAGWLQRRGAQTLVGEYVPTKKNAPVKDLFPALGFRPSGGRDHRFVWPVAPLGIEGNAYVTVDDESSRTLRRVEEHDLANGRGRRRLDARLLHSFLRIGGTSAASTFTRLSTDARDEHHQGVHRGAQDLIAGGHPSHAPVSAGAISMHMVAIPALMCHHQRRPASSRNSSGACLHAPSLHPWASGGARGLSRTGSSATTSDVNPFDRTRHSCVWSIGMSSSSGWEVL
jgi:hypothetical protein